MHLVGFIIRKLMFSVAGCLPMILFEPTGFDGYQQDLLVIMPLFVCSGIC